MCEANLTDPNARLEKLFETCAAENGYTNFKRASEAREPILLILDGINEATQAQGTVNDIAQWLRTEFDTASVLVADRMTPRGTYPNEYKLATLLPLSSEIVQSVLSEPEQAGNGTEGAFSRMLRLPFFLDLYRGDPSGSRPMDLLIRYVHRMLVGDRMSDPTVSYEAPSVIKLAGIAFDGYQQTRTPGISVEVLRSVSAGTLELTPERLRGSGLMRSPEEFGTQSANPSPTGGILVFRHQLIQDSLAAWHFVRGEFRPEPQHLQTLTLDRQSSDALVLAHEAPRVRANTLMIGVYDWDHPIALSCLLETRTDPKETLATAICAVIAQKKHDRFLHTRLRIEGSLSALGRFLDIREDFTSEELLQYVIGMEERFQGTDLSKWWRVFTSREASDEVWRALTGRDDPLSRWAAAATLRRMDLRPYELPLKQLY